ncbi:MAG: DUF4214 domain-containing protein [Oscillospiraceae bacterium]|nr:DUF4214 domain-containing protein [Oscillospiraceae bacterium]
MKKMKRLLVLCLVVAMCMGLAIPARAVTAEDAGKYVTQLYVGLLGRNPDEGGKVTYINMMVNNGAKAGTIAEAIAGSAEFRARVLTNEEYVTALYRGLLGREPDANGMATFKGALDVGYSRNWVLEQLLSSLEFTQQCLNFGLQVGSVSSATSAPSVNQTQVNKASAAEYVERLYVHLLGRSAEGDMAANNWVMKLTNREMSAAGVAASIAASQEFNSKSYTNGEFVQKAYLALLGRNVDSDGWTTFMTHLNNGKSRSWVFSSICASAEFQRQFGEMNAAAGTVSSGNYAIAGNQVNVELAKKFVNRAYLNLLNRYPTDSDLDHWVDILVTREMSAAGVAANIASSSEARAVDRNREDFVTAVYYTLLDRAPDDSGRRTYTNALTKGYSRSWVFTKICASAEFQSRSEFADMNVVPGYLNSASYNMG